MNATPLHHMHSLRALHHTYHTIPTLVFDSSLDQSNPTLKAILPPDVYLMSSPFCQPENAAIAARVSESLPVTPIPPPSVSAAVATGTAATATDEQPSSLTALTGSPPIPDARPTAVVSPPFSGSSSVPVSSSVSPSSAISAGAGHGDQVNKRARPPLAVSRSNGPSLLTQALASARGILPSTAPSTDQRQPDHHYTQPNDLSPRSNQPQHVSANGQELTPLEPHHDALAHRSDVSTLPVTPQRRIDPPRAISSPILHSPSHPAAASVDSSSVAMSGLVEAFPVLRDHPGSYFTSRARGRSLERTEKEARVHRINVTELPLDGVGETAYNCGDSAFSRYNDSEANSDSRAEYRAWRTERTVSMGPEKAWSIGTEDVVGHQDGQVEKSIAEVLAGMEPTRSRKASHSLRFFKEGLPADKVKRKEPKATPQQETTSPSKGQPQTRILPNETPKILTPPHRPVEVEDAQPLLRIECLPSSTHVTETPLDGFAKEDCSSLRKSDSAATEPAKFQDHAEKSVSSTGLTNMSRIGSLEMEVPGKFSTHDPAVSASHVTSEAVEEGEESSEEKISSALFLPHQSLEDSAGEGSCVIEKVEPQHPSTRSSTKKDFHPWLVKADEPEAEGKSLTDVHHEDVPKGRKDSILLDRELPNKEDHEDGVPNENEVKTKPRDIPAMASRPVSGYYEDILHDHQLEPKVPLEAIELIPYKHQVGGHTTIWRFSKRAVCKQLNNRENEFYEKIERYHRDLLPFLPRYIGVLNVTYQKQPRRRSTARKDDNAGAEKTPGESDIQSNGTDAGTKTRIRRSSNGYDEDNRRRIVSQSLRSGHTSVPTVTFMDNQHILPRSMLQPSLVSGITERPRSASAAMIQPRASDISPLSPDYDTSRSTRPTLEDRHANSWGATMVNKRLRNEVFNDAFLKQPFTVHKHRRPASYHRSVPRPSVPPRQTKSVTGFPTIESENDKSALFNGPSNLRIQATLQQSQSELGPNGDRMVLGDVDHVKDVTGTSAPEAEVLGEKFSPRIQKRRYSGSKLRRKPQDVGDSRGDLKYFEDADDVRYGGDGEAKTFSPLLKSAVKNGEGVSKDTEYDTLVKPGLPKYELSPALHDAVPGPEMELRKIPRPINPKEAQTQRDSRVEYFLLLEDLTAGMKRPCIMDLKMGTRQYGVEANPKKRESQRRKCAETTSRELGVRVCGLQTWDARSQTYVFRDKYYGRDIKAGKEFQDALTMFLYDGVDYSSVLRHIPTILQKLNQLEVTIRRLRGYRFYAASLLMFYDAGTSDDGNDTAADDSTTDFATDTEDAWDGRRHGKSKAEIDFKMADFANSVTAGDLATDKPCPPTHPDEPDRGFLRGLATLRKYFMQIQKDVRSEMGLNLRKLNDDARGVEDEYDEPGVSE